MIAPVDPTRRRSGAWPFLFSDRDWDTRGVPDPARNDAAGRAADPALHRILLIEDNQDAANALCEYLELCGHQVRIATTGPEGLRLAGTFQPTLVVCDIGLPEMDGWAVARALRSDPATASVRLVAVTGYGTQEDRQRSREAGFEAHLTKPLNMDVLDEILAR